MEQKSPKLPQEGMGIPRESEEVIRYHKETKGAIESHIKRVIGSHMDQWEVKRSKRGSKKQTGVIWSLGIHMNP